LYNLKTNRKFLEISPYNQLLLWIISNKAAKKGCKSSPECPLGKYWHCEVSRKTGINKKPLQTLVRSGEIYVRV
jgi:hypothetical protein